jgi:hypothetical protein
MFRSSWLALALASLAACGGDSGTDDYQLAVQQASDKQAEAISLAPASPCASVQQCGNLVFVEPNGHCSSKSYYPYSLASATAQAAASAAADEQALALHAVDIAPPPVTPCTGPVGALPRLACVANTCQAAAP